ncbi:MAG: peptide ABC transporter substrate-binding protein [Spirochaetales bacterium]|nr:peptide ABC transporter substrate-binding protein [Spirochaetales bacterium]
MKLKKIILCLLPLLLSSALLPAGENHIAEKTLIVSLDSSEIEFNTIQSFSATEAQLFSGIHEGLVSYHPFTLDPLPGVAIRWETDESGKIYTFYLREDALYWNGDQVTASDFRETWMMLLDPSQAAPYSFLLDPVKGAKAFRTGENKDPETVGIRVIADHILEIELESPADYFLKILCHHSFSPLHPQIRQIIAEGGEAPGLGNGPFYIYKNDEDGMIFLRNELYWDVKDVNLQQIKFIYNDDETLEAELFNQGEIHWSMGNILLDDVLNRQSVVINPLFATTYYFFSSKTPPFDNPDVRRALALLLPWDEIRSTDFHYTPAASLIPSLDDYPEAAGIQEQDLETARELLAKAGYPEGEGLPELLIKLPQGLLQSRTANLIMESWKKHLKTEVNFQSLPSALYYNSLKEPGYTLGTVTWIGDFADPLTFLQMWASDSNLNDGGYSRNQYDELLNQAASQIGKKRLITLSKAEEFLLNDGTVMPISHQPAFNVVDLLSVHGWYPNPLDIHPFKYMEFSIPELPDNIVMAPTFDY